MSSWCWINVRDRLPEHDGTYLIVTNCMLAGMEPYVKTARFIGNLKRLPEFRYMGDEFDRPGFWNGDADGDWWESGATHWMPLPELPDFANSLNGR